MNKVFSSLFGIVFLCMIFGQTIRIGIFNSAFLTPLDISVGIFFIIWGIKKIITRQKPQGILIKPLSIFLICCFLSLLLNIPQLQANEFITSFLYFVRLVIYVSMYAIVVEQPKKIKHKLPIYLIGISTFLAIAGCIQFILYTNLINLSYLGWDEHWYRLFATFFDPNFIAIFFVITIFITLHYVLSSFKNKVSFFLFFTSTLIQCIALFLTFSRSGFLAFSIGILVFLLHIQQNKKILYGIIIFFLFGIGIILLNYQATEGTKLFRVASSQRRIFASQEAITIFQKSPIFGIGFDAYRYAKHRYGLANPSNWETSHSDAGTDNSFLFVLATTGIVGLSSFIFLIFRIITFLKKNIVHTQLSLAVLSSFVALCVGSFFVNGLFYPSLLVSIWILLGIIENT